MDAGDAQFVNPPGVKSAGRLGLRDGCWVGVLVVAVCLVYGQTASFEYVNLDDPVQIAENKVVQKGLTWEGLRYAFTATPEGNFMPITWLSHMVVVQIGGHSAATHHIANVALHAITAGLVYLFWRLATGWAGPSAIVAGLFALHPLRAESVAWISERKDVLSGVFWMLCLLAYLRYSRAPSLTRYLCVAALFTVGLLSKSMLVTLPCVMLLLDFWPLCRLQRGHLGRIIAEKVPLFALAAACAAITYLSQETAGAVSSVEALPIAQRLWNAPAACGTYLIQTIWPTRLAVMYPYLHSDMLMIKGGLGAAAIAVVSVAALLGWRKHPYLVVGWLWFVGTLVPVIGLVQVGMQAHADRYTYVPHIGLFVGVVWVIAVMLEGWPRMARAAGAAAAVVILALGGMAWRQAGFWKDSEALFARSLAMTGENSFSEGNYAVALIDRKKYVEAERHLRRVIAMGRPASRDYHNLGFALMRQNRPAEAQYFFEVAVLEDPKSGKSWLMLGNIRTEREQWAAAAEAYRNALALDTGDFDTQINLGIALGMSKQPEAAEAVFKKALAERPEDASALSNYGLLLVREFRWDDAAIQLERRLRQDPDDADTLYYLGVCRAWQSRFEESLTLLAQAIAKDAAYRTRASQDQLLGPLRGYSAFQKILAEE